MFVYVSDVFGLRISKDVTNAHVTWAAATAATAAMAATGTTAATKAAVPTSTWASTLAPTPINVDIIVVAAATVARL